MGKHFVCMAYATIWVCMTIGIVIAIITTRSAGWMWFYIIPALVRVRAEDDSVEEPKDRED